jgi:pimeloyl-ACP methyl ester carboxylesterase
MQKPLFSTILKWLIIYISLQAKVAFSYSMQLDKKHLISYTDSGKGAPLVLIHAFPTDKRLWLSQKNLSRYFRVITIDLPGFGQSSPVYGQTITMTEYADVINQLLDQLHIKKSIIGGESMGGYIALAFLNKYPKKVKGLVLSDTQAIADSKEIKAKRELAAIDVLENGATHFVGVFLPKALSPDASRQTKLFLKSIMEAEPVTAIASALRGMAKRFDTSKILASTSIPILIVTGENDMVVSPKQSENMHRLAKNSQLIIIANAGHLSSLEQPEAWNRAVVQTFN